MTLSADSDGDGLPDHLEDSSGLNRFDSSDALQDQDGDGLHNLDEFQIGTDLRNPDTDGDGLLDGEEILLGTNPLLPDTDGDLVPDGLEVQLGSSPLDPASVDLARAIARLSAQPPAPTLIVNSINPVASVRLRVDAVMQDGISVDITATARGTSYASSDLNICNFGARAGEVFAGQPGQCIVTVRNGPHSVQVPIRVENFTPSSLSQLTLSGAVALDLVGNRVVAVGGSTLRVVNVSNRQSPAVIGTVAGAGPMVDVRVAGNIAYAAGSGSGVLVFDIANPQSPKLLRTVDTPGSAVDVAVIPGERLFVADSANGVLIFDIAADPATPSLLSTTAATVPVVGVAVNPTSKIAALALGTGGLQLLDFTSVGSPQLRGGLPGGNVRDVEIVGSTAFLADYTRSFTAVDIGSPDAPILAASLPPQFGGFLYDIGIAGDFAFGADEFFVNDTPVIDIGNPLSPTSRFLLRFPGDASGTGVKADASYVYLLSGQVLNIGQYRALIDNNGVPPQVSITNPPSGSNLVARTTVPVTVSATDDVQVSTVLLLRDGQTVGTLAGPSGDIGLPVPKGVSSIKVRAQAIDLAGNLGQSEEIQYDVIVGPLTTVTGSGVNGQGGPVANARINVVNEFYAQSGANGQYSIGNVPAALGRVRAFGEVAVGNTVLRGRSDFANTVPNGTTDVGPMVYFPDADWDGLSDAYESAHPCLAVNSADDEADPDGDSLTTFREYQLDTDPCVGNLLPGQTTALSALISLRNGPAPGAELPPGFNESSSSLISLRNGLPPSAVLPAGFNHSSSALISLRNGPSPSAVLPAGFNESSSALISLRNGPPTSAVLPAGFNETSSSLISLRNGTTSIPPGQSETFSFPLTISNRTTNQALVLSSSSVRDESTLRAGKSPAGPGVLAAGAKASVVTGETFVVRYDANDSRIRTVEFLLDGASLGEVRTEPFEAAFVIPSGVSSIQVRAIAKGSDGVGLASADQIISVVSDTQRPTVIQVLDQQNRPVPGQEMEIVRPGLLAEVFDFDRSLREMPVLRDRQPNLVTEVSSVGFRNPDGVFGLDPFGTTLYPDFAIRLSGRIEVLRSAEYQFSLRSHEGALLRIGGKEVIVVPGDVDGSLTRQGTVRLSPGFHEIVVEYYVALGPPELDLGYGTDGGVLRAVPPDMLTHVQNSQTDAAGILDLQTLPVWMQEVQVGPKGGFLSVVRLSQDRATVIVNSREVQ